MSPLPKGKASVGVIPSFSSARYFSFLFLAIVVLLSSLLATRVVGGVGSGEAVFSQTTDEGKASEKRAEAQKGIKFPPCRACTHLVASFQKGIDRTARGHFGGGDTAWEEKKQGSYARSEVRLTEIQETLCHDTSTAQHQCHQMASEHESLLEEWWQDRGPDASEDELKEWLCIEQLKVCCPKDHFGSDCSPCPGIEDGGPACGGNGVCKGSGTRKGSGKCECGPGYSGALCRDCSSGHFKAYEDEKKTLCTACHESCVGSESDPGLVCTGPGPKSCSACKRGWTRDSERGCVDIDECITPPDDKPPCDNDHFCANSEGSYSCLSCDSSCDGCTGDGPDMCIACQSGHVLENGICVDKRQSKEEISLSTGRYITYFGLCLATFIIFQKNVFIAGVVGMLVAIYVSVSEYWLRSLS